ncbi:SusC/RagA family TonB-linked outer membrane protein [Pedobacter ginsengisoli]|uniref:SusC/RagA family TonB-linked outer membrane protein n=1 Tax=Pedobacter ginsengisoli TaxID=363852 RepID=A0A2D1U214_9SPHI|nr:TonB-dependent receptor [Pedobacter ginsengisoli]ATP55660.1 SusC/RagA family TonB-linked outer membrane protein [Pedobacter ginsengisoli]
MRKTIRNVYSPFWPMTKKVLVATVINTVLLSAQSTPASALIVKSSVFNVKQAVITGTVHDETGKPLPGVSVIVKGTTTGSITDEQGKYSINAPDNATLVFTYIGYTKVELPVGGKTVLDINLTPDQTSLNELIVVGYGTQKKETVTGSISQVKGTDLVKSPQPNLSNALAGRFSGVVINNRGGEPGYDGSSITIRGQATTGSNAVLVVVDGVPGQIGGLERLDPNDIESVSVLKDASAAIYGNRAANGVILVTTKKGKTGKPTISYSFNQGFSSPTRLPKLADAATYAQIMNEINYYASESGGLNQSYSEEQIQKFRDGSDPILYPNTDWAKTVLKKSALQNQHSLSVNGGTDDVKYYMSLGMIDQDGIYKNGVTNYKQYNFRSNIDANVSKRLKVGLSIAGREENRKFPITGANDLFRSLYRSKPIVAAFYPNGLPTRGIEGSNPAVLVTDLGGTSNNPTQVINAILRGSYQIPGIEGLSADGFFSVDKSNVFVKTFNKPYLLYEYQASNNTYTSGTYGGNNNKATLKESQKRESLITSNIKLNFERSFGLHEINAFVGYEQSKNNLEFFDADRFNYLSNQLPELSQGGTASTDFLNSGYSSNYTRQSIISKLAYTYDSKYLFEGQLRRDGSSIFAPGKQWGTFPSVSAGWRINKEKWFGDNVKFFDELKLRASYGSLGNDNVNAFQYYDNYTLVGNGFVAQAPGGAATIQPGVGLSKLANPNITWEVSKKLDIGINATFLKNFTFEAIYFKQKRSDILAARNASLPGSSGIVNPFNDGSSNYNPLVPSENIGKVNSEGFEGTLGYTHRGNEFNWGVSGNMTYAKSEVIFIDEASGTLDYQKKTGRPLNSYLLYNAIGIFRTQADLDNNPHVSGAKIGDLIYEDYNRDGVLNADDMSMAKYGNIPQITYGFNFNASYKNFDLSVLFAGQARVSQYVLPESGSIGNFYSSWADNRFSPSNPNGSFPRVTERAGNAISGGAYKNNFWLNNSSFLRLKNVELAYNLKGDFLSKIKVSGVRIFASAFNLFTITKVKDYDPEGSSESGQFYPQQRIINLGANVKF